MRSQSLALTWRHATRKMDLNGVKYRQQSCQRGSTWELAPLPKPPLWVLGDAQERVRAWSRGRGQRLEIWISGCIIGTGSTDLPPHPHTSKFYKNMTKHRCCRTTSSLWRHMSHQQTTSKHDCCQSLSQWQWHMTDDCQSLSQWHTTTVNHCHSDTRWLSITVTVTHDDCQSLSQWHTTTVNHCHSDTWQTDHSECRHKPDYHTEDSADFPVMCFFNLNIK